MRLPSLSRNQASGATIVASAAPLRAEPAPEPYAACSPDKEVIRASELPDVVDQDRCPVAGRHIVDAGGLGATLPPAGMAVIVDAITTTGGQELTVTNNPGDTFEVSGAGEEHGANSDDIGGQSLDAEATGQGCGVNDYNLLPYKVYGDYAWSFRAETTPADLTVTDAENHMIFATDNIVNVDNPCGTADGVEATHTYNGQITIPADIVNQECSGNDGVSVSEFGNLPDGVLGTTCTYVWTDVTPQEVDASDMRLNSDDYRWTVTPNDASCTRKWDVQGVTTHERGHTYGMGHVPENTAGSQTMSRFHNGACQAAERSLGRGNSKGLNQRYL
jgi:hypothetical protein